MKRLMLLRPIASFGVERFDAMRSCVSVFSFHGGYIYLHITEKI